MTQPRSRRRSRHGGFLALARAGFHPLRQVQGTSVVSLGCAAPAEREPAARLARADSGSKLAGYGASTSQVYYPRGALAAQQYLYEGGWFELEKRTAAYNDARRQALARLRAAAEAGRAGRRRRAHPPRQFAHARHAIEFTALGTAIASDGFDFDEQEPIPLVSVSGGDFWKLVSSGYWPLGLVGGTSVGYVVSGYRTKYARFRSPAARCGTRSTRTTPKGCCSARLQAAGRLRQRGARAGATGVLGIEVRRGAAEEKDDNLLVTVDVLGNAIAPIEHGAPPEVSCALGLGKS